VARDGSATVAVRVRIPEGFITVKPMPKPGWKLDVIRAKYQTPLSARGTKVTEGVSEVDWSGRRSSCAWSAVASKN
jgi:uncharacterized protein YcnI